jgi:hypothetical protein
MCVCVCVCVCTCVCSTAHNEVYQGCSAPSARLPACLARPLAWTDALAHGARPLAWTDALAHGARPLARTSLTELDMGGLLHWRVRVCTDGVVGVLLVCVCSRVGVWGLVCCCTRRCTEVAARVCVHAAFVSVLFAVVSSSDDMTCVVSDSSRGRSCSTLCGGVCGCVCLCRGRPGAAQVLCSSSPFLLLLLCCVPDDTCGGVNSISNRHVSGSGVHDGGSSQ